MHIRFAYDADEHTQIHAYATEFTAFWRDQFGTIHFVAIPDVESWYGVFESLADGIRGDLDPE